MKNIIKHLHTSFRRLRIKIKQFFCFHYWFIYTDNEPVRLGYENTTVVFSQDDVNRLDAKYDYNLFPKFFYRNFKTYGYNVFCCKCKKEIMNFDENNKFLVETKEAAKTFVSSKKS